MPRQTTMKVADFTQDYRVFHPLNDLKEYWKRNEKIISDIVDDADHQYVDLVMEGGGVLGIALVGFTYTLESVGIRFLGIGGTSAGAINAVLLAGLGPMDQDKASRMVEVLGNLDMFEFVDGDSDAKDFVKALVKRSGWIKLGWKGWQVMDNINDDLGLNPGDAFLEWLSKTLGKAGIKSTRDLKKRLSTLPKGLRTRKNKRLTASKAGGRLAVVAADITTETKVVFPEMAGLYWRNPGSVSPANYVRASMSIPLFFQPYRVSQIPQGPRAIRLLYKHAGYKGRLPGDVVFVDGGIMSNFPINLFHSHNVPSAPTFGVKLGTDRTEPKEIRKPWHLAGAVFDAARHGADYEFIIRNPDYSKLVTYIRTGSHHWLNFNMTPDDKIDLFSRGVVAGAEFLRKFNWEDYKEIRRDLSKKEHTPQ